MPSLAIRNLPKITVAEPKVTGFGNLGLKKPDQKMAEPTVTGMNILTQVKKETDNNKEEEKKMETK